MDRNLGKLLELKSTRVDEALEAFLRSDPEAIPNLHDGMLYSLGLDQSDPAIRGKRIRPALCLLVCEALDGDEQAALPFAMAVELMHNFFLVHDDIEDGDDFRRGRPSTWKRYGLAHGINIGDFLLTQVFAAVFSACPAQADPALRLAFCQLLVDTLVRTHCGQAQDINALRSTSVTIGDYLEIVTNKTGFYLAAPLVGGALAARAEPSTLEILRQLGRLLGPLFQIVDDTIDLTHGKGRESVGSDIREGKRSYLVAYTASKAAEEETREMFRILDLPREETTPQHIEWVRVLFNRYGAIEAGSAYCRGLMDKAHARMAPAPERLRSLLMPVFEALLDRKR